MNDRRHIKYYNTSATRRGAILLKWYSMPLLVLSPVARHVDGARIFLYPIKKFIFCLHYFGMAYLKAHEHLSASHWIISYIVDTELSHLCNEWNVAMTSRVLNNIGKVQDRSRPNTDLCKEAWSCAIVFKQILYHTISMSKT